MKAKLDLKLRFCRARHAFATNTNDHNAAYCIKSPLGRELYIIVSDETGWDHVSVSVINSDETPTWAEMCHIKDLFFDSHEVVLQYHPARSEYVNIHPGCLHLWRPQQVSIPTPPLILV